MASIPPAGGMNRTTAPRSFATFARAAVRWPRASGDSASCARISHGRMVSTTYGRSSGFCIDPIEKKPLNHFYPGSAVLSFGTAGCNLGCKFCQNWEISKSREVDAAGRVGRSGNRGPCGPGVGLPKRGVYLQRPGGLGRVCDRLRQGLPCRGREDRGGYRRLYHALGAQDVL